MRVDRRDRRDMIRLAGANGGVRGRRRSAHRGLRISDTIVRLGDPEMFLSKNLPRCLRSEVACDGAEHLVSFHARGRVSRTIAATSSIAGVRPIASLNSPYRTGDNAPAPIVPV